MFDTWAGPHVRRCHSSSETSRVRARACACMCVCVCTRIEERRWSEKFVGRKQSRILCVRRPWSLLTRRPSQSPPTRNDRGRRCLPYLVGGYPHPLPPPPYIVGSLVCATAVSRALCLFCRQIRHRGRPFVDRPSSGRTAACRAVARRGGRIAAVVDRLHRGHRPVAHDNHRPPAASEPRPRRRRRRTTMAAKRRWQRQPTLPSTWWTLAAASSTLGRPSRRRRRRGWRRRRRRRRTLTEVRRRLPTAVKATGRNAQPSRPNAVHPGHKTTIILNTYRPVSAGRL